jgi:FkbM family methyltransferase
MTDIIDVREQRKVGILRNILRAGMSSMRGFLPKEPTLKQVNVGDLKVLCWINDVIGSRLYLARSYEPDDIAALKKLVRPGDKIADIGANIGYLSLHFAKCASPTGHVYAFEPMSYLHPVVTLNSSLNKLTNISVHPYVVSTTSEGRAMAQVPQGGAPLAFFTLSDDPNGVQTVRLDEFANTAGVERFDLVKIDVEGGEVSVLKGASSLLENPDRRPRVLMIEIVNAQLKRFGNSLEDVFGILLPLGYKPHIYRNEKFEAVADPLSADCWNVFFFNEALMSGTGLREASAG